jgi:hypothetical protein
MGRELEAYNGFASEVTAWRLWHDALPKRSIFHSTNEDREIFPAIHMLGMVRNLGKSGINGRFQELKSLVNGLGEDELSVPISHYSNIAERISDTRPGLFVKEMFETIRTNSGGSDSINLINVMTNGYRTDMDLTHRPGCVLPPSGRFQFFKPYAQNGNFFTFGFDIFPDKIPANPTIKIHRCIPTGFKSFDDRFEKMTLSEKAIVIAVLFTATDMAVTEKLKEFQKS